MDAAADHIDRYGTKHSEAIVTENEKTAKRFMMLVDAAALYHNASTRFNDGGALGFGAEIGFPLKNFMRGARWGFRPLRLSSTLCMVMDRSDN